MAYAQFAAASQFFLYGKRHFNRTGYAKHVEAYDNPSYLDDVDLQDKVFMVTGANAGIGKEITRYLAKKGATVYMVCRSLERGGAARDAISAEVGRTDLLHVLQADVGLRRDVTRCWQEFTEKSTRLDGLVCNAGVLLNSKTLTDEGVEMTLASHFLFGVYLLGSLALPTLASSEGRLVFVSSGGMYNTRFPDWETANALKGTYDGTMQYAYMKRGSVLLAERWAIEHPEVKVVSCHPGWTGTDAVESWLGSQKSILEPMRTPWEGAEGICWLLACPREELVPGAFYLDRKPQTKHMAGPFFTEGSFTKNSAAEVGDMMCTLAAWATGLGPNPDELRSRHEALAARGEALRQGKLQALDRPIDVQQFMGQWYVVAHVPTFIDKNTSNGVENYTWDADANRINVEFTYMNMERTKTSSVSQTAKVINDNGTEWKLSVKLGFIRVSLGYTIIDCAEDYSTCVVGNPDRNCLYIMARTPSLEAPDLERLKNIAESAGYTRAQIKEVPQVWDSHDAPTACSGEIEL